MRQQFSKTIRGEKKAPILPQSKYCYSTHNKGEPQKGCQPFPQYLLGLYLLLTSGTWSSGQGIQYSALALPLLPKRLQGQQSKLEARKQGCARPTNITVIEKPLCNGLCEMCWAPAGADLMNPGTG